MLTNTVVLVVSSSAVLEVFNCNFHFNLEFRRSVCTENVMSQFLNRI